MKRFIVKVLAIVGGVTILFFATAIGLGIFFWKHEDTVNENTVLELNLGYQLAEYTPDDPTASLVFGDALSLKDIVEGIDYAAKDSRVLGLVVNLQPSLLSLSHIQEIRDAVLHFRKSKKFAYIHTETFNSFGPANGAYYLASAFDKIYMQPSGNVGFSGLMAETPFLKGALAKIGVTPLIDKRKEYKNMPNLFTEEEYTPAHEEATQAVIQSLFSQIVNGIASERQIPEAEVIALADQGTLLAEEALEAKIIDDLLYWDQIEGNVRKKVGNNYKKLKFKEYIARIDGLYPSGETIALIYGVGGIQRGKSEYNPWSENYVMGSATLTKAFRDAVEDDTVKAIVFRVNSPGGSYVASDSIWREVVNARKAGKPVIVSMSEQAASGGYFVSMAADKIIAQPSTLTGSIGVFMGKFFTRELWNKLGVTWDEVHTSQNTTMWSPRHEYTGEQWQRLQTMLDAIYDDFTAKASEGRNLPLEKVLEIAKGRVWTGAEAKELGLVDDLGGMSKAIQIAKKAANIDKNENVQLKVYPKMKTFIEMVLDRDSANTDIADIYKLMADIRPVMQIIGRINDVEYAGELTSPEMNIR